MKKLFVKLYKSFKNDGYPFYEIKMVQYKRMLALVAYLSGYDEDTAVKFANTGKFSVLKNPAIYIEDGPVFQKLQKEYVTIAHKLGATAEEIDKLQEAVIDQAIKNNRITGSALKSAYRKSKSEDEDFRESLGFLGGGGVFFSDGRPINMDVDGSYKEPNEIY